MALADRIKDTLYNGIALGTLAPAITGCPVWILIHKVKALQGADLLLIGCIGLNAFTMNYFFKHNKENVGRGILVVTFIWAFLFFIYKINQESGASN